MKNAIVLCSGGIDSVVTAYYIRKRFRYNKLIILFFNYGQKSYKAERKSVIICSKDLNAEFKEIKLDELQKLSGSLINIDIPSNLTLQSGISNRHSRTKSSTINRNVYVKGKVRELKRKDLKDTKNESKKWYVPCRNLVFLSYALALAESGFVKNKIKNDIFLGFKNEGKEYYLDTTADFLSSLNRVSRISTVGKYKIIAPLIKKDKEDIVLLGVKLGVDFKKTFSCYINEKVHCGTCLACKLRQEGFYWANVADPTEYAKKKD